MGKKLITSFDLSGRPITTETWLHIQQAYQEQIEDICIRFILDARNSYISTSIYILYGCEVSNDGINWTINKGCIFYNGDLYRIDATTTPYSSGNLVANLLTTYYSGVNPDPIVYKDLSSHSPHQINKLILIDGASGTGTFNGGLSSVNDYNNFLNLTSNQFSSITAFPNWVLGTSGDTPYCYKKGDFVKLRGALATTGHPLTGLVCQLPVGCRPITTNDLHFSISCMNASGTALSVNVTLSTTGIITIINSSDIPVGSGYALYLDNILFLAI